MVCMGLSCSDIVLFNLVGISMAMAHNYYTWHGSHRNDSQNALHTSAKHDKLSN